MYLVTGGAGFIGSNIVAELKERNLGDVVVVDSVGNDGIKWKNLARYLVHDIRGTDQIDRVLEEYEFEAILHFGAITDTTERDADLIVRSNFGLSRKIWEVCVRQEIPLIYASSAATYGDGAHGFDDDASAAGLAKLRPLNPYGWSKHLFDRWVVDQAERDRPVPPQWAGLKFFNVYGPNEAHKKNMRSVFSVFYERCAAGEPVKLFKSHRPDIADGEQKRDFVHVDDCVSVVMWLLASPVATGLFNVGTGQARSFRSAIEALFKAAGQSPSITYVDMPEHLREKYQYYTQAKLTRLRAAGYAKPFVNLEEGVSSYVTGYLATDDPHR